MSKRAERILAEIRKIRVSPFSGMADIIGLTLGDTIDKKILERIAEVAAKVK